ncbi:MAG: F0F1 ATP synthase subunit gamma [Pseudomonadota bacterium]
MSDTAVSLRRKIDSAADLKSVVRTMKTLAAASIGQYESSVRSLADYARSVELGLSVCLRHRARVSASPVAERTHAQKPRAARTFGAIVYGSDQGLVGQFNERVVDFAVIQLRRFGGACKVWSVGERARSRLAEAGLESVGVFSNPNSVAGITTLVEQILLDTEALRAQGALVELHLFYNSPGDGSIYSPNGTRLLPLDAEWEHSRMQQSWPNHHLPGVLGAEPETLRRLIGEYLFVCLFRAAAESLASENASRLAAMQRAEKSIDDQLEAMLALFHRLRQARIDEELFDVIAGFEALGGANLQSR